MVSDTTIKGLRQIPDLMLDWYSELAEGKEAQAMRVPRVQFKVWRLMALVAGVAFLIPIGTWIRDMSYLRASLLDRAAAIGVNERTARKMISMPNIAPESYEYWSAYVDQCARLRRHCERAASRPWRVRGPDPR
jgi:hypothetical protein